MPRAKIDKETILVKSLDVFRDKGYYNATFSNLAEACGIEKPHFYYYFNSKEDLMREVLEFGYKEIKAKILDKAYDTNYTPKQRLSKIIEYTRWLYTQNQNGCLMGNSVLETADKEENFRPVLIAYFRAWQEALTELYRSVNDEETALRLAQEDIYLLQGGLMLMKLHQDIGHLDRVLGIIHNRL